MKEFTMTGVPLWQFENLACQSSVTHYVSGRAGGVSSGEIGTLNLGNSVGDDPLNVKSNRILLANALGISLDKLIIPSQTHSNHIAVIRNHVVPNLNNTDGIVTDSPGICIAVLAADCVPVLLYDPNKRVIAAIHSGWKGTVSKIVTVAVNKMMGEFECNPSDILAGIGPSIGPESYEVGEEVINAAENSYANSAFLLVKSSTAKARFDLWKANYSQLCDLGILDKNIEIAGICTYANSGLFFSARRSQNKAGRFSAGIMLN